MDRWCIELPFSLAKRAKVILPYQGSTLNNPFPLNTKRPVGSNAHRPQSTRISAGDLMISDWCLIKFQRNNSTSTRHIEGLQKNPSKKISWTFHNVSHLIWWTLRTGFIHEFWICFTSTRCRALVACRGAPLPPIGPWPVTKNAMSRWNVDHYPYDIIYTQKCTFIMFIYKYRIYPVYNSRYIYIT